MRFQQLKKDPNSIIRKKLIKSKKNWVVISSLSIAGGILLLSSPATVKADTTATTPTTNTTTSGTTTPVTSPTTSTPATTTPSSTTTDTTTKTTTSFVFTIPANITLPASESTVTIPSSDIGSTISIPVPTVSGYTANKTTISAQVTSTGVTSTDTVTYTGNSVPQWTVSALLPDGKTSTTVTGTTNSSGQPLKIGDTFSISPTVTGYTVIPGTGVVTADNSGNPVYTVQSQPIYVPDKSSTSTITFTAPNGATSSVSVPSTNLGNTTVSVPNIPGYVIDPTSPTILPVTYGTDGQVSANTSLVKYDPITIAASTATLTGPTGSTLTINIPAGTYGTTTNVATVPTVAGYTSSVSSLPVTYNSNGTASVDTSKIEYSPIAPAEIAASTINIKGPNGENIPISIPAGTVGLTTNVADIPTVAGYTSSVSSLPVTYNSDGTASIDTSKIQYTPTSIGASTTTIKAPNGSTVTINIPAGSFGTTTNTALVPVVPGYTSSVSSLPVTYYDDGTSSVDTSKVQFTPIQISASTTTVKDPAGNLQTINLPAGSFGTTTNTAVVPVVPGYTSNVSTLPVTYNPDGTASVDTSKIQYSPIQIPASSTTVKDYNGNNVTITIPAGSFGTTTNVATIPTIPGYTSSVANLPVTYTAAGNSSIDTSKVQYTPIQISASTTTIKDYNGNNVTIDIPAGNFGTTTNVALIPVIPGYTSNVASVPVSYSADGTSSVDTSSVSYTPIHIPASTTTVKDYNGNNVTVNIPAGNFGTTTNVALIPSIPGYTANVFSLPVTYNSDGTSSIDTSKVQYTPITIPATSETIIAPDGSTVTINIPAGSYGTTTNVALVPSIPGYSASVSSLPVTYSSNSTSSVNTSIVKYIPIHISASTTTVKDFNGNNVTIDIPAGDFGTTTNTALIPAIPGYTSNVASIPVTYTTAGTSTVDISNVKYSPISIPASTTTIKDFNGNNVTVDIPAGSYGETSNVAEIPQIPGYTSNISQLPVTYTTDGKAIVNTSKVAYNPIHSDASYVNFVSPDKKQQQSVQVPAVNYGDVQSITVPEFTGYTTPTKTLPVQYDTNGKAFVDTSKVTYTPVHTDAGSIVFVSPDSEQSNISVDIPAIDYGESQTINVPTFEGYTPNEKTLPIQFDKNGKAFIDNSSVKYTGNPVAAGTAEIDTSIGKITVSVPAGNVGDTVTVNIPSVDGFTNNVNSITGKINSQGKFVSDSKVVYTQIPKVVKPTINNYNQTVATYYDQPNVQIYNLESNGTMSATSLFLNPGTDWLSDENVVINGIIYYRVATNEWIKAAKSYQYFAKSISIRTYNDSNKNIISAEGNMISDRLLAANSGWLSDRTIQLNNSTYYRVATNEFVNTSDAYIYQPIRAILTTRNIKRVNLYTAKGDLISNRSLGAKTRWLTDSIVYINNVKYYRVATNEFVKASDVETF